ncbi:MAG TPA: ROK family protein, partial [Polyangiaceae bacterium]|nr:ROK family protein [Polyangiaceae bacterium]
MRIGVDLGGSKIEALALADDGGEILRRRVPTPAHDADAIVAAVVALVRDVERELGQEGRVGIATPGAISPATGLMKNSNTTCLNGKPLDRMLERAFG